MDTTSLVMWVVYDHPTDFPNTFVARRFSITARGAVPSDDVIVSPDLDGIRLVLAADGLTSLSRSDGDDPIIVETWL
jgi:hypothetical protein